MSRWTPCKRRDFIRRLRILGFDGPFSGTRHQFMVYKRHRLSIPSNTEYSIPHKTLGSNYKLEPASVFPFWEVDLLFFVRSAIFLIKIKEVEHG